MQPRTEKTIYKESYLLCIALYSIMIASLGSKRQLLFLYKEAMFGLTRSILPMRGQNSPPSLKIPLSSKARFSQTLIPLASNRPKKKKKALRQKENIPQAQQSSQWDWILRVYTAPSHSPTRRKGRPWTTMNSRYTKSASDSCKVLVNSSYWASFFPQSLPHHRRRVAIEGWAMNMILRMHTCTHCKRIIRSRLEIRRIGIPAGMNIDIGPAASCDARCRRRLEQLRGRVVFLDIVRYIRVTRWCTLDALVVYSRLYRRVSGLYLSWRVLREAIAIVTAGYYRGHNVHTWTGSS